MPTVIDTLIIELGLDPSKFTKGQKEAMRQMNEAREQALRNAQDIEKGNNRANESVRGLQATMNNLGAFLLNSSLIRGFTQFSGKLVQQDAAAGRLAYTLGTNVKELDKWRNAAYLTGGSASTITGDIQGLTNQFQDFAITGESSVIPWFRALNVQIADANGKMRPFEEVMKDLANAFQKMDPVKAAAFGRNMGMSQDTINLLVKGGDELERILKLSDSNLDPKYAENARQIAEAWGQWETNITKVGRALTNTFTPGILTLLREQSKTFTELSRGELISRDSWLGSKIYGTQFRGWGPRTDGEGSPTGSGAFKSQADKEAFIRGEAVKRGISPDVAMAVARSEGFNGYKSDIIRKDGTREPSYGAFQLYTGGGLGNVFQKKTGLDPRDPATEREQIQFALDQAKTGGWSPFHGAKRVGIDQWQGIEKGGSSTQVKIDQINIQTQATDAQGVARDLRSAIERSSNAAQSQSGPQ